MSKQAEHKDYKAMSDNLPHRLHDEVEKNSLQKVQELVTDDLINQVSACLKLSDDKKELLEDTISIAYLAYDESSSKDEPSRSLSEQRKSLKKVCNVAGKLLEALDELEGIPQANQKFYEEYARTEKDNSQSWYIKNLIIEGVNKEDSPEYVFKEIVEDILFAADKAAFDWKNFYKDYGDELEKYDGENKSDKDDDLQILYAVYGTKKWVSIRRALLILKNFWSENVEEPFSAGRYYKDVGGYNSRTIEALELILTQVDSDISQRNIVTHMLAINP